MGISTDRTWRQDLIFLSFVLMLSGLFISRALLSISIISFLFFSCMHKNFPKQLSDFIRSPLCMGLSLLFFLPLLTWFWSEDKESWMRWIRIKLPLFLLPLGFAGGWQLSRRQWAALAFFFIFLVFAGCCWTLGNYAASYQDMHENYLRAHVLPTPFDNDHVRFSLVVCLAIIVAVSLLRSLPGRLFRYILIPAVIFFILFLHLLAARTGLLSLYVFAGLYGLHLLVRSRKKRLALTVLAFVLMVPFIAWFTLPTFQNRVRYFLYDLSHIRSDSYLPGSNDGNRLVSLRAGWAVLKEYPFGVGSGDVIAKTNEWYSEKMPQVNPAERLYPSSEWLLYGASAGWPGVAIFAAAMILPFFERFRKPKILWHALIIITALSLAFDIGLETQFGVYIHAFTLLAYWKWMRRDEQSAEHLPD